MSEPTVQATNSILHKIADYCEVIAMTALLGIAGVQLWQVFARYIFNQSLAFSEPLSAILLSMVLSFSAASAVHQRRHFRFSWLVDQLALSAQRLAQRIIAALTAVTCLLIAIKTAVLALDGIAIKQAGILLPIGSIYVPMSLAMLLAFSFAFAQIFSSSDERT